MELKHYKVKCLYCGRDFISNKRSAMFCTKACANKYRKDTKQKVTRVCEICKDTYTPKTSNQKYCSFECKKKADRIKAAENKERKEPIKIEPKNCEYCGLGFIPITPTQKYCSKSCKEGMKRLKKKIRYRRTITGKRAKWTKEEIFKLEKLKKDGFSDYEIAKRLGKSVYQVRYQRSKLEGKILKYKINKLMKEEKEKEEKNSS